MIQALPKCGRDKIDLPARGFSVLMPYRDYASLSVAIGIY